MNQCMIFMIKNKLKLEKYKYGIRDVYAQEKLSWGHTDYSPFEK